jgi:chaperonin GroES
MIKPLTGQVLIRLLPPDETNAFGLFLPDVAYDRLQGEKAKPRKGLVITIGPWKKTKEGFAVLSDFKPGDTVLVSEYLGTKLTRAIGETLRLCRIEDVLAVLTDGASVNTV